MAKRNFGIYGKNAHSLAVFALFILFLGVTRISAAFDSAQEFENDKTGGSICTSDNNMSAEHWAAATEALSPKKSSKEDLKENKVPVWFTVAPQNIPSWWFSGVYSTFRETAFKVHSWFESFNSPMHGSAGICGNSYIVQPYEYINRKAHVHGSGYGDLTATDVPFYYSCENPVVSHHGEKRFRKKPYGEMGAGSQYCMGKAKLYAEPDLVGKVRVEYGGGKPKRPGETRPGVFLKSGESAKIGDVTYTAYRYLDYFHGKEQICVAVLDTTFPIKIGCSYVAPPTDEMLSVNYMGDVKPAPFNVNHHLIDYLSGTRCSYMLTGRKDLWQLGHSLPQFDSKHHDGRALKMFLESDFHVTSTVIGCLKDMLMKVYTVSPNNPGEPGMLAMIQKKLRNIVYAALILYLAFTGIKIISSPQVPQRGELAMLLMKFALVVAFTAPEIWYHTSGGKPAGILPTLLASGEWLSQLFLNAHNMADPVGLCRYSFHGTDLLGSAYTHNVALPGNHGSIPAHLSVWDLVDCKVTNYLTLGSCNYSIAGMISMWLVGASMLKTGGEGIIVAIVGLIYIFTLLLTVFKFAHTFIVCMFSIFLLVLVSPIILCFSLFQATKSVFQSWFRMMIGYTLMPAFLFMLLALMLLTFDNIYFGDAINNHKHGAKNIQEACKGVDSIFCTTVGVIAEDPCSANLGDIGKKFVEADDLGAFGRIHKAKTSIISIYMAPLLKLMLLSLIFYMFLNSAINLFTVVAGVSAITGTTKGSINILTPMQSVGGGLTRGISTVGGMATGFAIRKLRG